MNILHLRASNFYGGPERQLHFHARMAGNSKYDITIGSFTEDGYPPEFLARIADDGIEVAVFDVRSAYDPKGIRLLREYLKSRKIDILCTHDYRTHFIGYLALRGTGSRWLAFSRGFTLDNFKVRIYHWIEKALIRFADHIVAVSGAQKNKLRKLMIPKNKISVAYNAIDPRNYSSADKVDIKGRFGFPPEAVVAVAAGRFSREKGQEIFVKAAVRARQKLPQLYCVLFGEGPDLEKIRSLVKKMDAADYVICPGFEKNLTGCLMGADMVINPSITEGLPNVVLEAMAVGTPVIATAVGGVPEVIENERNGILVKSTDIDALAEAIIRLGSGKIETTELNKAARKTLEDKFTFEKQYEILAGIYNRLAPE